MMIVRGAQHKLLGTCQTFASRGISSKAASEKKMTWVQTYCCFMGTIGALYGGNEGFWEGMRISAYNPKKRQYLPVKSILWAASGAVIGVASVPTIIAVIAYNQFEKAYENRKKAW